MIQIRRALVLVCTTSHLLDQNAIIALCNYFEQAAALRRQQSAFHRQQTDQISQDNNHPPSQQNNLLPQLNNQPNLAQPNLALNNLPQQGLTQQNQQDNPYFDFLAQQTTSDNDYILVSF